MKTRIVVLRDPADAHPRTRKIGIFGLAEVELNRHHDLDGYLGHLGRHDRKRLRSVKHVLNLPVEIAMT
jgi:hypothetical protein